VLERSPSTAWLTMREHQSRAKSGRFGFCVRETVGPEHRKVMEKERKYSVLRASVSYGRPISRKTRHFLPFRARARAPARREEHALGAIELIKIVRGALKR